MSVNDFLKNPRFRGVYPHVNQKSIYTSTLFTPRDNMNGYEQRYNEKRPVLGFRVSPEVNDKLLELQDGSGKTKSELAEMLFADAIQNRTSAPPRQSSEPIDLAPNGNPNNINPDNVYNNGYQNGHSNGVKDAIKQLNGEISKKRKPMEAEVRNAFKKYLKDNETECPQCGGTFIDDNFDCCPYCKADFDGSGNDNQQSFLEGDNRIPIISDVFDNFFGSDKEDNKENLNFTGGKQKDDDEEFECSKCGAVFSTHNGTCPECSTEFE
ncbi:hypothetical protein ES703_56033 [subsurface metagenome]